MHRKFFAAIALSLFIFSASHHQQVAAQDCAPPKIIANANSGNLFSPEQEMILGDLTVERMSGEIRFAGDEQLLAYVNGIGERLVKHLPPKGLKYRFHIIDIPDANAFNIPGGHVFLSRKLIAFVNNEDELAGVMAHELGHAAVNHAATDVSESLRKILNVTTIGDRRDIAAKYNLLIENARTKRMSRKGGHENEQQLEADKIGLFAMVAAGYAPSAFSAFFDRLTEAEGKTGSWFSDIFGKTRPEQKRLREMIRATEQLPQTCRDGRSARATQDFLRWQADVISFRRAERKEELPGLLWKKELSPKLRSDISYLTFSADGKYLLAQDDFAVTVIEREPLRVLFQIPAEGANNASFTPDGKFVIFSTESLRYEKWSVEEKKPVETRELVIRRDCWEHELSPDGRYLACVDTSTAINVIDTNTGKKIWEKKEFYPLTGFEYMMWLYSASRRSADSDDNDNSNFFRIKFTPDSRYVLFSRSDKYRYRIRVDGLTYGSSENTALALDLTTLKQQDVGGEIKRVSARPYLFLDPQRILGMGTVKIEDGGIFSFPEGKRLGKFSFAAQQMKMTSNPNYAVIKPLADGMTGIFDLKKAAIASATSKADVAMWNDIVALEQASGEIVFKQIKSNDTEKKFDEKEIGRINIPVGSIGSLSAAGISSGFKWLILSSKTRGGLWNLDTGERKIFVRGFRGGIAADDGGGVAAFPKLADTPHSLALLNANNEKVTPVGILPEKGARQYGRFLLIRKSLKEPQKKDEKKSEETKATTSAGSEDESANTDLRHNVRFELKDFILNKVLWTRDFPKEAPRYSFDEYSGRLIFYWQLGSEAGKARLRENPELQAKADALGDKASDYLVEIVDAFAEKTIGMMLLETGKGSFFVGAGLSERDWLALYDSEGRVLIYSIATGDLKHRFFGKHATINPVKNQIAVENFPGEINVYNLDTGESEAKLIFNGKAAFARFSLDGKKLFVLSDLQSAYAFDLGKMALK